MEIGTRELVDTDGPPRPANYEGIKADLGLLWNGTTYGTAWCFRQQLKNDQVPRYGLLFPDMADRGTITLLSTQLADLRDQINSIAENEPLEWYEPKAGCPWSYPQSKTGLYKLCFPGRKEFGELLCTHQELRSLAYVLGRARFV